MMWVSEKLTYVFQVDFPKRVGVKMIRIKKIPLAMRASRKILVS